MPLMVNGSQVNLDINATNNASPVIKQVAADIGGLETSVKNAGVETGAATNEFDEMMSGVYGLAGAFTVATTAVSVFVGAYQLGEIGAQNTRLIESGQTLAKSYGDSLDNILASVSEASLGTVSNMSIIESANKAMMLGVSGSAEQLAQLMEIAALRGRAMGISTTQAFDDMVRGIGRMSPMILDNLGIVVDAEGTYGKYADSIGKSASELTRSEKIQALLNKVIEEGNKMLDDAGGLVDDNAAKYERLQARIDNYQASLAMAVDEAINPSIAAFLDMADAMDRASEATGLNDQRSRMYLGAMELELQKARDLEERIRSTTTARLEGLASLYETTTATMEYAGATEASAEAQKEAAKILSDYYEGTLDNIAGLYSVQSDFVEKQDDLKAKQSEVLDEINTLIEQGWSPYSEKVQDLQAKYDDLGVKIDETAEKHRQRMGEMQYDLLLTQLSADGLTTAEYQIATAAGVSFGVFDQAAADSMIAMQNLTGKVQDGSIDVDDYAKAFKKAMDDGVVETEELLDMLERLPLEKTIRVNLETYGFATLGQGYSYATGDLQYQKRVGNATGTDGWEIVPPGFPNDTYPVGLTSGERYAVIPANVPDPTPTGRGFGGGGSAQVVFAPTIQNYFGNESDMMRQLYPAFVQMLDQAKADGHLPAGF